jgi:23S rRNA (cytosine1962-C5)-methyltransferase
MQSKSVVLKAGKDKAIRNRHHWIFSGAVQTLPSFKDGDFLPVYTADGQLLGSGYFNRKSGIVGRMVVFDDTPPLQSIEQRLLSAWELRKAWFDPQMTNAFRLINGEGDGLPGLIIDVYDQVFVIQCGTKGIDKLKPWLIEILNKHFQPKTIYEKSIMSTRREEGLQEIQGVLAGENREEITFKENGLIFTAHLAHAQKTGFFLDHREMRQWVRSLAQGKKVLNAFSYTGGFSVYALAGGAQRVDSVDISEEAIEAAKRHAALNHFVEQDQNFYCADVFAFLREKPLPYDLVILDPPAFAKKQKDVIAACRGYKDINRLAMQKMPARSLLFTCSCSHYVDESLFQKVLFQAAWEAKREVRIIGRHRLAIDHPINLYHPESDYLKSFLLYIE